MNTTAVRDAAGPVKDSADKPFSADRSAELKLPTAVLGLDVAPDDRTLFAACMDGGVYAVDRVSGEFRALGQHESYASGVVLAKPGGPLISAGYDGMLQWHDPAGGKTIRKVEAHDFWSWRMAVSSDGRQVASVTGRYECGGYKYEPAPEREPSVKVFDVQTGRLIHEFPHTPPVESVAFSPDGQYVAAGNLMGEVRVWDLKQKQMVANWTTPDFTGWGIIKGHYYTGGVFAIAFSPDMRDLMLVGMGTTRDPAAGNGRQLWQRYAWRDNPPKKVGQTHEGDSGQGLMETLAIHPSEAYFVMAGRLKEGKWNVGLFDMKTGRLGHSLNTKMRVTQAVFSADGGRLYLSGCVSQPKKKKDGQYPSFGRVLVHDLAGRWSVS